MALTAYEVMQRAHLTLNDSGLVRWTAPELREYLNDGMRQIAMVKPTAVTDTVELTMEVGTRQQLPATMISIIRVTRNLDGVDADVGGRTGGRAIRPVARETLDAIQPGWQDPTIFPHSATVEHVIADETNPREFFVVPGNDGTGVIEATVALYPTDVPLPANPLQLESYTATLTVPDLYRATLVDYILYRAYAKDSENQSAANRSISHYNAFNAALVGKMQVDQNLNVNRTGA